jgi:hypothetical protein
MMCSVDTDLYWRGIRTVLAASEQYARGAAGTVVHQSLPRGCCRCLLARFPSGDLQRRHPPRARSHGGRARRRTGRMRAAYETAASGVTRPGSTEKTKRCACDSSVVATDSRSRPARWAADGALSRSSVGADGSVALDEAAAGVARLMPTGARVGLAQGEGGSLRIACHRGWVGQVRPLMAVTLRQIPRAPCTMSVTIIEYPQGPCSPS